MRRTAIVWISQVFLWGMVSELPAAAAPASAWKNTVGGLNVYLSGTTAVKKRDYAKGIQYLSEAVDSYPGARWQDGAHYRLGQAHIAHDNPKRNIEKAQMYFQRLLTQFPKSPHRWDAENYLKLIEEVLQPRREVKRIKEELLKE